MDKANKGTPSKNDLTPSGMRPLSPTSAPLAPLSNSESLLDTSKGLSPSKVEVTGISPLSHSLDHVDPRTHLPPSIGQTDVATTNMAKEQTLVARHTLDRPNDILRGEVAKAAGQLHKIMSGLDADDQKTLGTRLLGKDGLLKGGTTKTLMDALQRASDPTQANSAQATTDRRTVIALMGDIGALYADTGATTGVEDRTPDAAKRLRTNLDLQVQALDLEPPTKESIGRVQSLGGSSAMGPNKKTERKREDNVSGILDNGIHGTGDKSWATTVRPTVTTIAKELLGKVTEPLEGHMSGSPAEILQVWDMLSGVPANEQYTKVSDMQKETRSLQPMDKLKDQNQRYARAAGAAAFLIGSGYHSAVENIGGVLEYTGQSVKSVVKENGHAGDLLGHGAATDLIDELMSTNAE